MSLLPLVSLTDSPLLFIPSKQIVRKRLNRPLTLAEKVSKKERRKRGRRDKVERSLASISLLSFSRGLSSLVRPNRARFFLFSLLPSALTNVRSPPHRPLSRGEDAFSTERGREERKR